MKKELIKKIKKLKKEGKTATEISKILNIPVSTVRYYYDKKYKIKTIDRAKKRFEKKGDTRDKENRREYSREYNNRRYEEDPEFREKMKKANRKNQKKVYALKKMDVKIL